MSVLLFKRFLAQPFKVAYVFPSSRALVRRVAAKCDFSAPRVIVELGPGEGVHTRELLRRMHPGSRLFLIEIDPELAAHLRRQFAGNPQVEVIHGDAANLKTELAARGVEHCDYVVSGIPFSCIPEGVKRGILAAVHESLAPGPLSALVVYQCTHELKKHATMFPRVKSEYCWLNLPPIFVTVYHKEALAAAPAEGGVSPLQKTARELGQPAPVSAHRPKPHGVNGVG